MKMEKSYAIICWLFVALLSFTSVKGQHLFHLSDPHGKVTVSEDFVADRATDVGAIYYGSVPSGSNNKPVLVFIHGYSSEASTWWDGNDMYSKAFYAGYRTAFVSVNPDKSMWDNGQLFRNMLQTITNHYGVSKVVVVAHSKGGVDTDAALIHYGGWQLVDRVVTLSTPHFGTPLADLAQNGWVWWLSAVFGQFNDATYILQTGYMNYFRSITDTHPNNAQVDFRTIGAWGYGGILLVPGWYLNANGGGKSAGGNDGVVPFYSSKRPASAVLLGGYGDSRSNLDHFEVNKGSNVWNFVADQLPSGSFRETEQFPEVKIDYNPLETIRSSSQVLSADRGTRSFSVETNAGKVVIRISQFDEKDEIQLIYPNGKREMVSVKRVKEGGLTDVEKVIEINAPAGGTYQLDSKKPYVAVITTEAGLSASLKTGLKGTKRVFTSGEIIEMSVSLENRDGLVATDFATGTITLVSDLEGNPVGDSNSYVLDFEQDSQSMKTSVAGILAPGVYNLMVQAESGGVQKTVISSFAVVANRNSDFIEKGIGFEVESPFPNPFSVSTTLQFTNYERSTFQMKVYTVTGKLVFVQTLGELEKGKHQAKWEQSDQNLYNGLYFIELSNGKEKVTKRVILRR